MCQQISINLCLQKYRKMEYFDALTVFSEKRLSEEFELKINRLKCGAFVGEHYNKVRRMTKSLE